MKSDPAGAAKAILLSRAVMKNIRQNLFWAFFYNCLGIPLAAGVFYNLLNWQLSPMFASAAMSLSSVSVVTNALRLRGLKLDLPGKGAIKNKTEKEIQKTMKATIKIDGMMCMHCVSHVESALKGVAGVVSAKADLGQNCAFVEYEAPAELSALEAAIESAGYKVVK